MALAGRSNVGKSSLLNALAQMRGLARTSRVPGRTRRLTFFLLELKVGPAGRRSQLVLVDLPGYGYAQVSERERRRWKPLVESYLSCRTALRGVVLVVDVRRGLGDEERELLGYLAARGRRVVIAATKVDRVRRAQARAALARLAAQGGAIPVLGTSARTGEGVQELMGAIVEMAFAGASLSGRDRPPSGCTLHRAAQRKTR